MDARIFFQLFSCSFSLSFSFAFKRKKNFKSDDADNGRNSLRSTTESGLREAKKDNNDDDDKKQRGERMGKKRRNKKSKQALTDHSIAPRSRIAHFSFLRIRSVNCECCVVECRERSSKYQQHQQQEKKSRQPDT